MSYQKSKPIRVDIREYIEAERLKDVLNRSIQGQISHWSKIGRHITANPDLTGRQIESLILEKAKMEHEGYPVDISS